MDDMGIDSEILADILAGKSLDVAIREHSISPDQLIHELARAGLEGAGLENPALVQQAPRHPRLREPLSERSLARIFPKAKQTELLALSAGILLIHDFWDESHEAAQRADDLGERSTSAYWHGIAHRREPDPGNASYWFRRVGRHPIFPELADAARPLIAETADAPASASRLVASNSWDPYAMIELCSEARRGSPTEALALAIQRVEMRLLLNASLEAIS